MGSYTYSIFIYGLSCPTELDMFYISVPFMDNYDAID